MTARMVGIDDEYTARDNEIQILRNFMELSL